MSFETDRPRRLAVLIDADNASSRIAAGLFEEIATIEEARVRHINEERITPSYLDALDEQRSGQQ